MTSEKFSDSANSFGSVSAAEAFSLDRGRDMFHPEMHDLLQRCRDNLETMDSLLLNLESVHASLSGQIESSGHSRLFESDVRRETSLKTHSRGSGGDSIRRIANDIESLCQRAASDDARQMLNLIQSRMARCLRLIPSGS